MIGYEITAQNYELIRNQIGAILAQEFESQASEYYNTDCEGVDFYIERVQPIDHNELAIVNVSVDQGEYGNKHQGSSDGTYTFFVDAFANSKSTASHKGDKLAGYRVQRIIGICRAILDNPIYKTLSFAPGFIMRTMVMSIEMLAMKQDGVDALNSRVCRLTFQVKANESVELPAGNLLTDHITRIHLGLTDKGFRYVIGEEDLGPIPDQNYVKIVNQNGETVALLQPPEIYTVEQLQEIIDTITDNDTTIIDPIT